MSLAHRAFIHQPNGIITVSDGTVTASFDDVALLLEIDPDYALPSGVVAVNYEKRGATLFHRQTLDDGSTKFLKSIVNAYEDLIDQVDVLAAAELATHDPIYPILNAATLADAKALADVLVDNLAGEARAQFITVSPGQDAVYIAKEKEGRNYRTAIDAGETPDLAEYPMLKGRAERLNNESPDYLAVAGEWITLAGQWLQVSALIENEKEGAKDAISTATAPEDIQPIIDGLVWPSPS